MSPGVTSPIVLIGPMGSGKSKVGKRLAQTLELPFIDTDTRVVESYGAITNIFASHGEAFFREKEREAVAAALKERAIVSLGGGAVLDPDTQKDLRTRTVILLTVSPEAVAARIKMEKRPLLAGGMNDWNRIYSERKALYNSLATITFDTSEGPMKNIAAAIAEWVRARSTDDTTDPTKD